MPKKPLKRHYTNQLEFTLKPRTLEEKVLVETIALLTQLFYRKFRAGGDSFHLSNLTDFIQNEFINRNIKNYFNFSEDN